MFPKCPLFGGSTVHSVIADIHLSLPRMIKKVSSHAVTLSGDGTSFQGFLLQARLMADDSTLAGFFSAPVSGTQPSDCDPSSVSQTLK